MFGISNSYFTFFVWFSSIFFSFSSYCLSWLVAFRSSFFSSSSWVSIFFSPGPSWIQRLKSHVYLPSSILSHDNTLSYITCPHWWQSDELYLYIIILQFTLMHFLCTYIVFTIVRIEVNSLLQHCVRAMFMYMYYIHCVCTIF